MHNQPTCTYIHILFLENFGTSFMGCVEVEDDGQHDYGLLFATDNCRQLLQGASSIHSDGTFYTCPDGFAQIFVIAVEGQDNDGLEGNHVGIFQFVRVNRILVVDFSYHS